MEGQQVADEESIIAQFYSTEGVSTGPQLDIPLQTGVEQLHALVNELLGNVREFNICCKCPFECFLTITFRKRNFPTLSLSLRMKY